MPRTRTVVVAGAGIGGLATALTLARAGFRVVLAERAEKLEAVGAGIQLSPNATRALAALGLLERVRERAVEAQTLVVASGRSSQLIARTPFAGASADAPWLLVTRADLQDALYTAAADDPDIEIELGTAIVDAAEHPRGVTAIAQGARKSTEYTGLALVGADGLWSATRTRLHPNANPMSHGLVAWRTLIPAAILPPPYSEPVVRLWLGPGAHLVHYPVAAGAQINLVAIFSDPWRSEDWDSAVDRRALGRAFGNWGAAPRSLLAAAGEFRRWALHDLPPLPHWGTGAVTLLGDAAHPMLPFLAQGAAAALEDAVVLGRHLAGADDVPAALRAYENERARRTNRLQIASRGTARHYHLGGIAGIARNIALRAMGGERLIRRNEWIYRYDARA